MTKKRVRQASRRGQPELERWLPALIVASFLVPLMFLVLLFCDMRAQEAQFLLIDGVFQTLDPLRRLFSGQVFFRDFVSYLGIGHTLMYVPLFALLGQTLYASMFSAHFVVCIATGASLVLVAAMVFRSWRWGAILAAVFLAHAIFNPSLQFILLPPTFIDPGVSGRPIRLFLPTLIALILYFSWPRLSGKTRRAAIHRAAALAGLGAVSIFYSNDYGLPVAVTLPLVFIFLRPGNSQRGIELGIYALVLPILIFLLGNLLTLGHFFDWYRYNFDWVARSQFWYFEDYTKKLVGLGDWLQFWMLEDAYKVRMVACVPLLIYIWFRGPAGLTAPAVLLFLGITHLLSAIVVQFGSWRDSGYELGLALEYKFIELYCILFLLRQLPWARLFKRLGKGARRQWERIVAREREFRDIAFVVGALTTAIYIGSQAMRLQRFYESVDSAFGERPTMPIVDRTLDDQRKLDMQVLASLKAQLGAGTVLSEYSGLDLLGLGKISDSRAGLIIHAFGGDREAIVDKLTRKSTALVSTVSNRFTNWIEWSVRQNWWFYRPLYENYQLVAASPGYLFWKPRVRPLAFDSEKLTCRWTQTNGRFFFSVTRESGKPRWKENALAELELTVRPGDLSGYRKTLQRELLVLAFPETPMEQVVNQNGLRMGRPVVPGSFAFPIEVRNSGKMRFEMNLEATFPRTISVEACAAKVIAPMSTFRPPRERPYAPRVSE